MILSKIVKTNYFLKLKVSIQIAGIRFRNILFWPLLWVIWLGMSLLQGIDWLDDKWRGK